MDYGGLPTYINNKLVHLQSGLCRFLHIAQSKLWVAIWSFMKSTHTQAVVEFIFKGIKPPLHGARLGIVHDVLDPGGEVVRKPRTNV
jgi:hypothetical protein